MGDPLTKNELNELRERDKQGRCQKCGTKIEMYDSNLDWCPKCRIQSDGRSAGITDTERRLLDTIDAMVQQSAEKNLSPHLAEIESLRMQNAILRQGLRAVETLMAESHGVAGLHLNGDSASWGDLRQGGRHEEWLIDFDIALELHEELEGIAKCSSKS